jgi:hypothetical protein
VGDQTRFEVGGGPAEGVVNVADIRGHEAFQPDFSGPTRAWWDEGTGRADRTQSSPGRRWSSAPESASVSVSPSGRWPGG